MRTSRPVNPLRVPRTAVAHHRDFASDGATQGVRLDTPSTESSARALSSQGPGHYEADAQAVMVDERTFAVDAADNGSVVAHVRTSAPAPRQPRLFTPRNNARGAAGKSQQQQKQRTVSSSSLTGDVRAADRVDALRWLLRQVELPSLDTALIHSQLLPRSNPPWSVVADKGGEDDNDNNFHQGRVVGPTPVPPHVCATSPSPRQRQSLANVPLNHAAPAKRSNSGDDVPPPPSSGASSTSATIESPLLSLTLLKESKHAGYYLPDDTAKDPPPPRTRNAAGVHTPIRLCSVAGLSREGKEGGHDRTEERRDDGSTNSSRHPAAAVADAAPPSSSEHGAVLLQTEAVLRAYRTALAAALRAVQHREAVWTALQQFLHVVRRDGAPMTPVSQRDAGQQRQPQRAVRCASSPSSSSSPAASSVSSSPSSVRREKAASASAQVQRTSPDEGEGGRDTSAACSAVPALRTALRLSLDHILAPQPSPTGAAASSLPLPSSCAGPTSPAPPPARTPRPPLLSPSSNGTGRRSANTSAAAVAAAGPARPRAHSAATRAAAAAPPHSSFPDRLCVPSFHPPPAGQSSQLRSPRGDGTLPAMDGTQRARVALRRTPSVTTAAAAAAATRSRSAPREAPVASISPRAPVGRFTALTPRARILSRVESGGGSCALPPYTPPPRHSRQGQLPSALAGVVSLEARVHAVPRLVYTGCLYHYLFYLQHTTLAVVEAVAALRREHLHHPAPFIIEHRNYLLETLTQTAALAGDATVQWLLHDPTSAAAAADDTRGKTAGTRGASTPRRSSRSSSPLRSSRGSRVPCSPLRDRVHRSPSNSTAVAEQAEETAAHRALQVAAVQGRWPEQLLRFPLFSTHSSLAAFATTPALLRCMTAERGCGGSGGGAGGTQTQAWAAASTASTTANGSITATANTNVAALLQLPDDVLRLYSRDGQHGGSATDSNGSGELSSAATRRKSTLSLLTSTTAAQLAVDAALHRHARKPERPASALVSVAQPISPSLRVRLEEAERMLHREVAVALEYAKLCMQCALRHEYPLYLRGMVDLQASFSWSCGRAGSQQQQRRTTWRSSLVSVTDQLTASFPYGRVVGQRSCSAARGRTEKKQKTGAARCDDQGGAHRWGTVPFADEELRVSWMEELKVSWQLLMSGSSSVE